MSIVRVRFTTTSTERPRSQASMRSVATIPATLGTRTMRHGALRACAWVLTALPFGHAGATPPITDQVRDVTVNYENGDRLHAECNDRNECDIEVRVFGRTFKLKKEDLRPAGALFPTFISLTPLYPDELTYAVEIDVWCSDDERARWKAMWDAADAQSGKWTHSQLKCRVGIIASGNKVTRFDRFPKASVPVD
ncbi:hypothetical protein FHW12_002930 [Dokdonella fugitiva]|uniref:Uncharacterized protein n=1 Tax=Dokdonella fugitiva TaxID=328517 RepID=A0A839EVT8_9GAMM|nr:hypothetical protein [Dokdonella fugitiva]MBA8888697.1 hypothetical protein [Dokdonella fugitiva]